MNLERAVVACCCMAGLLALLGLLSWAASVPHITKLRPEYVPTSPAAAAGHLLLAAALWLLVHPSAGRTRQAAASLCAGLVLLLGVLSVLETSLPQVLRLPFAGEAADKGYPPGQLSPITGIAFILAGAAFFLIAGARQSPAGALAPFLALAILFGNSIVLLGYLYGSPVLYGGAVRPVGVLSAAAGAMIAFALLITAGSARFPLRLFLGDSVSARLLRSLLPATFLAVLLGELISDLLRRDPLMNPAVQDAIQTLLAAVIVSAVVLRIARDIGRKLDAAESGRRNAEADLLAANKALEARVAERTRQWEALNADLRRQIEERARIEAALRQSEADNRALLSSIPDWILRFRRDGALLAAREPGETSAPGHPPEDTRRLASTLLSYMLPELPPPGESATIEFHLAQPPASRDFEARIASGPQAECLAIVRDITDLKRVEERLLDTTAREQRRIGQELHDGLGQHLTGIAFMAKALEDQLAERGSAESEKAAEIRHSVTQAISEVRGLSRGLFQLEFAPGGLVPALDELCASASKMFQVSCSVRSSSPGLIDNPTASVHLYRIAQEAITNAVKHGGASEISVSISSDSGLATLSIKDDGAGFAASPPLAPGIGLRIMEYRARRLRGHLRVQSQPGGGTTVTCVFPVGHLEASPVSIAV